MPSAAEEVRAKKGRPDEPLVEALRCFLEDRPGEAVALLGRYHPANQEILLALLPALARLTARSPGAAASRDVTDLLDQLDGTAASLRPRAELSIDKMCFCRQVVRFGVYEPVPEGHVFRPEEEVTVYFEPRRFAVTHHGQRFETTLASTVFIESYDRKWQWRRTFPVKPYESRTPLLDYYMTLRFFVPDDMPPGAYTLWVELTDVPTKRTVRRSLDLRVSTLAAQRQ